MANVSHTGVSFETCYHPFYIFYRTCPSYGSLAHICTTVDLHLHALAPCCHGMPACTMFPRPGVVFLHISMYASFCRCCVQCPRRLGGSLAITVMSISVLGAGRSWYLDQSSAVGRFRKWGSVSRLAQCGIQLLSAPTVSQ